MESNNDAVTLSSGPVTIKPVRSLPSDLAAVNKQSQREYATPTLQDLHFEQTILLLSLSQYWRLHRFANSYQHLKILNITTPKTYVPSEDFPWDAKQTQIPQIDFACILCSRILSRGVQMGAPHSDQLALWRAQSFFVSTVAGRHCLHHQA